MSCYYRVERTPFSLMSQICRTEIENQERSRSHSSLSGEVIGVFRVVLLCSAQRGRILHWILLKVADEGGLWVESFHQRSEPGVRLSSWSLSALRRRTLSLVGSVNPITTLYLTLTLFCDSSEDSSSLRFLWLSRLYGLLLSVTHLSLTCFSLSVTPLKTIQ